MATEDKRIDYYISKSADFAQPILIRLRHAVHKGCGDVKETMKWSFPHFEYKGSILCTMASFKEHCAFGFWLAPLMEDPDKIFLTDEDKTAMGHLGQIKSIKDLPAEKILLKYIKQAMKLIDQGAKLSKAPKASQSAELLIPDHFKKELKKNKVALINFEKFNYTNKKEYVQWITEAKTESTREKRMKQAIEWIAEGKIRNWKYVR